MVPQRNGSVHSSLRRNCLEVTLISINTFVFQICKVLKCENMHYLYSVTEWMQMYLPVLFCNPLVYIYS